jgi:hypothetical protein
MRSGNVTYYEWIASLTYRNHHGKTKSVSNVRENYEVGNRFHIPWQWKIHMSEISKEMWVAIWNNLSTQGYDKSQTIHVVVKDMLQSGHFEMIYELYDDPECGIYLRKGALIWWFEYDMTAAIYRNNTKMFDFLLADYLALRNDPPENRKDDVGTLSSIFFRSAHLLIAANYDNLHAFVKIHENGARWNCNVFKCAVKKNRKDIMAYMTKNAIKGDIIGRTDYYDEIIEKVTTNRRKKKENKRKVNEN